MWKAFNYISNVNVLTKKKLQQQQQRHRRQRRRNFNGKTAMSVEIFLHKRFKVKSKQKKMEK